MHPTNIPTGKRVRDVLGVLLDRDVEVGPGEPVAPGPLTVEALYVDDRLEMRALAVADLPFAAYAGAAIGLLPPACAEEAVEAGRLGEVLQENANEIFNVLAALFNGLGTPHLRLYTTYPPAVSAPPDVLALAGSYGKRVDVEVAIAGYGRGALGVVLA